MTDIKKGHLITGIVKGSAAQQLDICIGDRLLSIDGHEIEDVLDYRLYISSDSYTMLIEKNDGEQWEYTLEQTQEDPGLIFENGLMSKYKSCSNHCIFCFIDQMPVGMRDTLYFKDDDSRLSFLQGNYVTLTNMKKKDIERIIDLKLEPINISVHTTNPVLRCSMLGNRRAGICLSYMNMLYDANTSMNGQIVLCKNYNDKEELTHTLDDLMGFAPVMESVSVVPVGLTKFRKGLCDLELFTKEDAIIIIKQVEEIQKKAYAKFGIHFAHASDELYMLADQPFPEESRYDGYLQLENGVGMMRLLDSQVSEVLNKNDFDKATPDERILFITGKLSEKFMRSQAKKISDRFTNKKISVFAVFNDFFGENITVSGLLTGQDIISQLQESGVCKDTDRLFLPLCMFKSGEEVLLDDKTRADIENSLHVKTVIVGNSGTELVNAVYDTNYHCRIKSSPYEIKEKYYEQANSCDSGTSECG